MQDLWVGVFYTSCRVSNKTHGAECGTASRRAPLPSSVSRDPRPCYPRPSTTPTPSPHPRPSPPPPSIASPPFCSSTSLSLSSSLSSCSWLRPDLLAAPLFVDVGSQRDRSWAHEAGCGDATAKAQTTKSGCASAIKGTTKRAGAAKCTRIVQCHHIAMSLPRYCHVVAMPFPGCHATGILPCCCHGPKHCTL